MTTRTWLAAALAAVTAACAPDGDAKPLEARTATAAAAPQQITITASDFHFEAPATVTAGATTIRLVNRGPDLHHVQLVRLAGGHTFEEVGRWAAAGGPMPEWMELVGGPNTPRPGGESQATVELQPGAYALVCLIPSPDGVPHLAKGMVAPMTVTAAAGPAAAPQADLELKLSDYAFAPSAPLTAGRRTIRVENTAAQPHEVILVRLAPGKTAADVLAWLETHQGDAPGEPVGGTTALAHGQVNYVTGDFTPGEYALLCMVPDAGDGKPHVAHGMVRQITVG